MRETRAPPDAVRANERDGGERRIVSTPGPIGHRSRRRLLVFSLLALALLAPLALYVYHARLSPSARVERLRAKARLLLRTNRATEALALLERAQHIAPNHPRIPIEIGIAYNLLENAERARAAFERAATLDPEALVPRLELLRLALAHREIERAHALLAWFDAPARAARVRPYGEELALLAFRLAWLEGDAEAVQAAAARAQRAAPSSATVQLVRIQAAIMRGDSARARELLQQAIDLQPDDVTLRLAASELYERLGEPARAAKVLEIKSEDPSARRRLWLRRAELACARSHPEAVRAILERLPEETPPTLRRYLEGLERLAARDWKGAIERLQPLATAEQPRRWQIELALARAFEASGRKDQAVVHLRRALVETPLDHALRLRLGRLLLDLGRPGEAAAQAERILRDAPEFLPAVELLVRARAREGTIEAAARFLRRTHPDTDRLSPLALLGRSSAELAQLDLDAAIATSETLLQRAPETPGAVQLYFIATSLRDGVVTALERLERLAHTSTRLAVLGVAYAAFERELGRADRAQAELERLIEVLGARRDVVEMLARVASERRAYPVAIRAREALLDQRPADPRLRLELVRLLLAAAQSERAETLLEKTPWPSSPPAESQARASWAALARLAVDAALLEGDDAAARRALERLDALEPDPLARWSVRVRTAVLQHDEPTLARLLAAPPPASGRHSAEDAAQTRWLAAIGHFALGAYTRAAQAADALPIRGSVARGLVVLDALCAADRCARAQQRIEAAFEVPGTPKSAQPPAVAALRDAARRRRQPAAVTRSAAIHRMVLAATEGLLARAADQARALARDPALTQPLHVLLVATTLQHAGALETAERLLVRARTREPSSRPLTEALATVLAARGDHERAARLFLRAAELAPLSARLPRLAGVAFERAGLSDEADRAYAEAIRRAPDDPRAYVLRARLRLRFDLDIEEALSFAQAAYERAPGNVRVLTTYGDALLRTGALERAGEVIERAFAAAPWDAEVRLLRGEHLARRDGAVWQRRALADLALAEHLARDPALSSRARTAFAAVLARGQHGARPGTRSRPGTPVLGVTLRYRFESDDRAHLWTLPAGGDDSLALTLEAPEDSALYVQVLRRGHDGPWRAVKTSGLPAGARLTWRLHLDGRWRWALELSALERGAIAPYRLTLRKDSAADGDAGTPAPEPLAELEPDDDPALPARALAPGQSCRGVLGPYHDIDRIRLLPGAADTPLTLELQTAASRAITARLIAVRAGERIERKRFVVTADAPAQLPGLAPPPANAKTALWLELESRAAPAPAWQAALAPSEAPRPGWRWLAEPDDDRLESNPVTFDAPPAAWRRVGTLWPPGDVDHVRWSAQPAALEVRAPATTGLRVRVRAAIEAENAERAVTGPQAPLLADYELLPAQTLRFDAFGGRALALELSALEAAQRPDAVYFVIARPHTVTPNAIDLEPNDVMACALTLRLGERRRGRLDEIDDRDLWRLELPAPTPAHLGVSLTLEDGPPLVLEIYRDTVEPERRLLGERVGAGRFEVRVPIETPCARLYLRVAREDAERRPGRVQARPTNYRLQVKRPGHTP